MVIWCVCVCVSNAKILHHTVSFSHMSTFFYTKYNRILPLLNRSVFKPMTRLTEKTVLDVLICLLVQQTIFFHLSCLKKRNNMSNICKYVHFLSRILISIWRNLFKNFFLLEYKVDKMSNPTLF